MFHVIPVICALLLLAFSYTWLRHMKPRWVGYAFALSALCLLTASGLEFYMQMQRPWLSYKDAWKFSHWSTGVGCIGAGILIAVFISGELTKRWWPPAKSKHQ